MTLFDFEFPPKRSKFVSQPPAQSSLIISLSMNQQNRIRVVKLFIALLVVVKNMGKNNLKKLICCACLRPICISN